MNYGKLILRLKTLNAVRAYKAKYYTVYILYYTENPLLYGLFLDHDIIFYFETTLKKIQQKKQAKF